MSVESLRGLNILVISPNEWGEMRVSKHHYAAALASRGNRVFFLNPPNTRARARISIETVDEIPGLSIVTYRPFVSFSIRFRSRRLFNAIARAHVRWLVKEMDVRFDIVWCFDANLYSDLAWFSAPLRIFHPVDQVLTPFQIDVAANADAVLSVSEEILARMHEHSTPALRVEHGLASDFVALAEHRLAETGYTRHEPIRVGYVGNLLIPSVDRDALLELVSRNDAIDFHFWGPRSPEESNVGGENSQQGAEFISALSSSSNVTLHGTRVPAVLAREIAGVDLLLMCYSVSRDPNRGCNSHKILEYMSTGRAIVANYVSDYADRPGLIEMPTDGTETISDVFDRVVADLDRHNGNESRDRRLRYALDNSYSMQLDRVGSFVAQLQS